MWLRSKRIIAQIFRIDRQFICNPLFITALIILVINDHLLKEIYHNWWTGKLSDIAGLIVLPLFLSYFCRRLSLNIILSGLLFVFWKSPYSQELIDFYNEFAIIQISRVVDYTDLLAVFSLAIVYWYARNLTNARPWIFNLGAKASLAILIPSVFVLMATAPPYYFKFIQSNGNLKCYKCNATIRMSENEILKLMKEMDLNVQIDSQLTYERAEYLNTFKEDSLSFEEEIIYYKIDQLVVDQDTLSDIQFSFQHLSENKTKIWIGGMNVPENFDYAKANRKVRRYYRKILKKHLLKRLK